jgi:hypothetical protein
MNLDKTGASASALALVVGAVGVSVAILGLAAALTACGGGDAADTATPVATAFEVTPVFDDSGQPSGAAKSAEPLDPDMRTRAGLYASPEQYRWEALMSSPYTVLVDLDRSESRQAALDEALVARRWDPSSTSLAWFVKASDLRAGARLADALTSSGLAPVFLIVGGADSAR